VDPGQRMKGIIHFLNALVFSNLCKITEIMLFKVI